MNLVTFLFPEKSWKLMNVQDRTKVQLLILSPTLLWVGLVLEALTCLLSTYPAHSYLRVPCPVPCLASALSTPSPKLGFFVSIQSASPLGSLL